MPSPRRPFPTLAQSLQVCFTFSLSLALVSCGGKGAQQNSNQLPTANAGGPYSANAGQNVTFDGSKSSDPDGDTLTYSWNFGDNSMGAGASPSHTYSSGGTFTVTLTVNDGRGGTSTASTTASINGVPAANPGGPYNGVVARAVQFDGSKSSDVDNDPLTFTWNFGDSSMGAGPKPTHTYASAGNFTVSLTVDDGHGAANSANTTANIMVAGPAVIDFNPKSGPVGTLVNVTGTNFTQPNGNMPQILLAAQSGGNLVAPLSTFTATTASFVIPAGAASGPFALSAGGLTANSPAALTITGASNFTLSAAPTSASLLPGQSVAYAVSLASANGFSQLAALSVTGLPPGVTASFSPTQIAAGQIAVLTLTAPPNQPVAPANLTISGSAFVQGIAESQAANVSLNVQSASTTLLGRTVVDDAPETPIAGVTIKFLGVDDKGNVTGCSGQTTSDAAGNFMLSNLPGACTGPQLISYDGTTATQPRGVFAGVNLSYTLNSGQVTTSPVLIHLPRIDNAETVQVQQNAGTNQTFGFKTIPNLVVTVYAGTTFTLADGTQPDPFPLIAVQVPVDRLPDQMPTSGLLTPSIVAFQPANAVASQPVSVNFPNILDIAPSTSVTLMTLDPTRGFMVPYGTATVSNDGTQFLADPDPAHPGHNYGLVHFDWHGPNAKCKSQKCKNQKCPASGKPIGLASGTASVTATDIAINGRRGSIKIERSYDSSLAAAGNAGPFGIGTGYNYGLLLDTSSFITAGGGVINLVDPNGNSSAFNLQSNGSFTNGSTPEHAGEVISLLAGQTVSSCATQVCSYTLRYKDGTTLVFQSPSNGPLIAYLNSIADPNGNIVTLVHGNSTFPDQVTQVTDPVGRALNLEWDSSDRITSITDPIGRAVNYTYNSQGTLAAVADPAGGVTQYKYDNQNRLIQEVDARGVTIAQNTYDANGNVIQQVQANGGVIKYSYTLLNPMVPTSPILSTAVTDPLGNVTTYRFDPTGLALSVTDPQGQVRTFTRDPMHNNHAIAITGGGKCDVCGDPTLGDQTFTYDAAGNTLTESDALGHTTTYTYDPLFNRVISASDPLGSVTKYAYDSKGNLLTVTDPNGNLTTYSRNSFGQVAQSINALSNVTAYSYDSLGNVASITDPAGNMTSYAYDAVSRLVRIKDPFGATIKATYDALDRQTLKTNSQGSTAQATYDPVGDRLSFSDEQRQTTSFTYDSSGRQVSLTDPRGKNLALTYDLNGNLSNFVNRAGQTGSFTYDAVNRPTGQSYSDGSTVAISYDGNGRPVHIVDSGGGTFDFSYDSAGHLTNSAGPFGTVQYAYDAAGRVISRQVAGQSAINYSYDPAGNLLSASLPQASASLSYDARNALRSLTRSSNVSSQYSYDSAGRLLSIDHSGGQGIQIPLSYAYDAADNRSLFTTSVAEPAATTNTYDSAHRLLQNGATTFAYDNNGNVISTTDSTGTTTYAWDTRNRLQSISAPSGQNTTFRYDFAGNLISQADSGPALNLTQNFVLDDLTNVAYIARSNGDSLSILSGRAIDQHLAVVHAGGQIEYGLPDAQNSTMATVDQTGKNVASFSYEPYGKTATTSTYPFQFTGRVPSAAGLYYFRARYYNTCGRFVSEDPLGLGGSSSLLYRYAGNSPLVLSDPSGREVFSKQFKDCLSKCMSSTEQQCELIIGASAPFALLTAGLTLVGALDYCQVTAARAFVGCAAKCALEPDNDTNDKKSCPNR